MTALPGLPWRAEGALITAANAEPIGRVTIGSGDRAAIAAAMVAAVNRTAEPEAPITASTQLVAAAVRLLAWIDQMTPAQFERGDDRVAREQLRDAIRAYAVGAVPPAGVNPVVAPKPASIIGVADAAAALLPEIERTTIGEAGRLADVLMQASDCNRLSLDGLMRAISQWLENRTPGPSR